MADLSITIGFLTSADGGLAHYVLHLWEPISKYTQSFFLTYADREIDPFVTARIPKVERLIDVKQNGNPSGIVKFFQRNGIRVANLHVGTTVKRFARYYIRLLSLLRADDVIVIETLHDVIPFSTVPIAEDDVRYLEKQIDEFDVELPKLDHFIVPVVTPSTAFLNLARTVCRRAERRLWALYRQHKFNENIIVFINRLADLLFTLMRFEGKNKSHR